MKTHARCRQCRARRVLSRHPDAYRTLPRCRNCGARDYHADKWMNERNVKAMTCHCSGHGPGYHYPHRRGALWCNYQPGGDWKTLEQFEAEIKRLEVPDCDSL
ncbi:hypothetical protein MAJJADAN_00064 [Pseudomonas phage Amjad_SA]|nr:hypothetical protein MAJJADAN_00064 [Pseudomonas phage Amjad_SA]